jgi:hypothetical protein
MTQGDRSVLCTIILLMLLSLIPAARGKSPLDQLPVDTPAPRTPAPVEPISAFPETATITLPDTLPSSLTTIPPPPSPRTQKIADDFCEWFHLHKGFTKNGKSWRCRK